jgi:hypothetical protein
MLRLPNTTIACDTRALPAENACDLVLRSLDKNADAEFKALAVDEACVSSEIPELASEEAIEFTWDTVEV